MDRDYNSDFASEYSFWPNTNNKEYTVIYHLIGDEFESSKDSSEEFDSMEDIENSDDLQMVDSADDDFNSDSDGETNSSDSFDDLPKLVSDSCSSTEVKLSEESEESPILSPEELSEISKAFCEAIDNNLSPEVSSEEEYEISPQVLELLSGIVSEDE